MNNQAQQEAPGVGSLRDWVVAILKGGRPSVIHTPGNDSDALQIMEAALKLPKFFAEGGYTCNVSATKSVTANGFGVAVAKRGESARAEFKVQPVSKATRPQAVAQTSKAAYHTIDFSTQRGKIAEAIWNESKAGKDVTRQELSILHGFEKNAVCGRVNELLKASQDAPFEFEGRRYRLVVTEPRLSRFKGASNVKNEGLRWWPTEAEQTKLFQ